MKKIFRTTQKRSSREDLPAPSAPTATLDRIVDAKKEVNLNLGFDFLKRILVVQFVTN